MKGYLLDTSICVFLFREYREVTQRLNEIGYNRCFITDIVLAELRYGAFKSDFVEEKLKQIVLMSPSGHRANPWEFIFVEDHLQSLLKEGNG